MPATKRRSARLARKDPQPSPRSARGFASYAAGKLSSLLERDETPRKERSINAIMSSPLKADRMPGSFDSDESLLRTPQTVPAMRPSASEMHPSKAQQSTTKEPDSGLRLGFSDIKAAEKDSIKALETTPSKSTVELKSPGFEFKWAKKDENDLGNETQRIMDSVREEAARIKEKMQAERDEQTRKDIEAGLISPFTGRKIATPRRKGRFSDAHQTEFSKMGSIADHVSVLKTKAQASNKRLKRTKSRADLDDDASTISNGTADRLENPSPGKRARTNLRGDVSSARPSSPEGSSKPSTRPKLGLPSGITTPTKASLARAVSAKGLRTLAKLPRAMSAKTLRNPIAPKSEGSNKYFSALARAPAMKSILHKPLPKYSNDPVKIANGTHVAAPKGMATQGSSETPTVKRVGFVLEPSANIGLQSPSPSKPADMVSYPSLSPRKSHPSLSSHPPTTGDFTFHSPNHRQLKFGPSTTTPTRPTVRRVRPSGISTPITPVETLPGVPHGMPNKKRRRADDDEDVEDVENYPPGPPSAKRLKQTKCGDVAYPKISPEKGRAQLDAVEKRKEGLIPKKKSALSLSRLNALARPKRRT